MNKEKEGIESLGNSGLIDRTSQVMKHVKYHVWNEKKKKKKKKNNVQSNCIYRVSFKKYAIELHSRLLVIHIYFLNSKY